MNTQDFLKVREFSDFFRMSTQWTRNQIHADEIKAIKVGRHYRIPRSELERLLNANGNTAA